MTDIQRITSLLYGYSVEVAPAAADRVPDFSALLPPGTTVNVTFLPGSDTADTVRTCARLRRQGLNPVPHLAARSLESERHLEGYLDSLVTEAAVSEVLVIGGGSMRQAGPYASTMQILASGLLERYGIRRIGVAGHPEGSPDIPDPAVRQALLEKNAWARDTGADLYIETQFCFDIQTILDWEERIRNDGNCLPVHVGVPGLATLKTLLKFARISGIGPSILVLAKQAHNITRLLTFQEPDQLVARLADAVTDDPRRLIRRIHFYPFGGLERTAEWANAILAGHTAPRTDGGFSVVPATP